METAQSIQATEFAETLALVNVPKAMAAPDFVVPSRATLARA